MIGKRHQGLFTSQPKTFSNHMIRAVEQRPDVLKLLDFLALILTVKPSPAQTHSLGFCGGMCSKSPYDVLVEQTLCHWGQVQRTRCKGLNLLQFLCTAPLGPTAAKRSGRYDLEHPRTPAP